LDFQAFGTWQRGRQPNGEFTQTSEQSRGGFAAKYSYTFNSPDNDFVVFNQLRDIAGQPNQLAVWVYGDSSNVYLNAWIVDNEGQGWSVPLGQVSHSGWQMMTGQIDTDQGWPWGTVYGPDNGQVDYPIQFAAFALDDPANDFVGQGAIYLDDLSVSTVNE
jgi:hypothetical protein